MNHPIEIAHDFRGQGPPLLLIAGFGMSRVMWEDDLCDALAARGFTVVRMDNRDTGASTRLDALGVPAVLPLMTRALLRQTITSPYTLEDMAEDAFNLMRSLGHERFHVAGASMGGMIAQTMAILRGPRLLSLTSLISTPGGLRYSIANPRALKALLTPAPREPAAQLEHFVELFRVLSGPRMPIDEERVRTMGRAHLRAQPSPAGAVRQLAAILESSPRRRARLSTISTPTLVIHGTDDPLLPLRGARAMTRLIPGAGLVVIDRMGHLFAAETHPLIVRAISEHAAHTEHAGHAARPGPQVSP